MYLSTEYKEEIFSKYSHGQTKKDTGSAESQIALFSQRINHINSHLQTNKLDKSSRLGLLKLVGKRKRLLEYLMKNDIARYRAILVTLGLRK